MRTYGFRSCLPLRDSPGFAPGSLFTLPRTKLRRRETDCSGAYTTRHGARQGETESFGAWPRLRATTDRVKARDIVVATHGHCFDGMASAALFTRLVRCLSPSTNPTLFYKSCGYGPGMQMIPEAWLDGVENAILDFRYTPSPRVRWYFDHHITGFGSAAERDAALAAAAGDGARPPTERPFVFYDPAYGSCTKLIADVAATHFQVDLSSLGELTRWADIIDTARFASAEAASSTEEPVMQLAAVVEHHADGPFLNAIVPRLLTEPLDAIARADDIQALWAPIRSNRDAQIRRIVQGASVHGRVVMVDLTDAPLDVAAKFATYALFPDATYSVTLSLNRQHIKLSVGYNPWSAAPREHDIASICRRYDGGGHPAVGACSFPLSAVDRAREVAAAITEELNRSGEKT